jgi:hypothetical protein
MLRNKSYDHQSHTQELRHKKIIAHHNAGQAFQPLFQNKNKKSRTMMFFALNTEVLYNQNAFGHF